jgi:hypothetical protein
VLPEDAYPIFDRNTPYVDQTVNGTFKGGGGTIMIMRYEKSSVGAYSLIQKTVERALSILITTQALTTSYLLCLGAFQIPLTIKLPHGSPLYMSLQREA